MVSITYIRRLSRVLIVGGAFLVLLILLLRAIIPSGHLVIDYYPGQDHPYVTSFAAKEESVIYTYPSPGAKRPNAQLMTQDPLFVTLETPRQFSEASIELWYRNPDFADPIRVGIEQSNGNYYFEQIGSFSRTLSDFQREWVNWIAATSNGSPTAPTRYFQEPIWKPTMNTRYQLWQRTPTYGSLDAFFSNLPPLDIVATHNVDLSAAARIPGYIDLPGTLTITQPMQGSVVMYTYTGGEPLQFQLALGDLNQTFGADPVSIKLFHGADLVTEQTLDDDGVIEATGEQGESQSVIVHVDQPTEGIYSLQLIGTEDTILSRIHTDQHLLVFQGLVTLVGRNIIGGDLPTTLTLNGTTLAASTKYKEGLQTLSISPPERSVVIAEKEQDYIIALSGGETTLLVPQNDISFRFDGMLAFSNESWFDPTAYQAQRLTDTMNMGSIQYIIGDRSVVSEDGPWQYGHAEYTGSVVYMPENRLQFIINVPQLSDEDKEIEIHRLRITLDREPLSIGRLWTSMRTKFFGEAQ